MVNPLNSSKAADTLDRSNGSRSIAKPTSAPTGNTSSVTQSAGERVVLSSRAQTASAIAQLARESDGVDPQRVDAIRAQIASGVSPSAQDTASAMLNAASRNQSG